jgi:hypothetical protein
VIELNSREARSAAAVVVAVVALGTLVSARGEGLAAHAVARRAEGSEGSTSVVAVSRSVMVTSLLGSAP